MTERDKQVLAVIAYALLFAIVITAVYKLILFINKLP
jgi:hypothetical protein